MPTVLQARSGKLVFQLLGGVTFAYDLHLGHSRDRSKGLVNENNSEKGIYPKFRYGVP